MTDTPARTSTRPAVLAGLREQAVLTCGPDGHIVRCNAALAALHGRPAEAIVGKSVDELLYTDYDGALWLRTGVGSAMPVRAARSAADAEGNVDVYVHDRSESTAAVHAREVVLRRCGTVLRVAGLAAFSYDRSSNTTQWLTEGAPLFGMIPGMLSSGLDVLFTRLHPDDRAAATRAWNEHLRTGAPLRFTARCLSPDGDTREIRCVAERDESGVSTGYVADIGAGNRDDEELRRSLQVLDEVREAGFGYWHVDLRTGEVLNGGDLGGILEPGPDRMTVEHMFEGIHPEDREQAAEDARAMIAGELAGPVRREMRTADGARTVLVIAHAELDDTGEVIGLSGTTQDITRLRRLERTVAEQRMKMFDAGKYAGVGTWERNPDTRAMRISAGLCEVVGIEPVSEIPDERLLALTHPDDRQLMAELLARVDSDPEAMPAEVEFRVLRPDGEQRIVRCYTHIAESQRINTARLFGTAHDVTRLRELESQVNEAHERSASLADAGMWTWVVGSDKVRVSGGLFTEFGLATGVVDFETLRRVIHPEDVGLVVDDRHVIEDRPLPDTELRAYHPDGSLRLVQVSAHAVADDGPLRLVGTVRDVTRLRELERRIAGDRARWQELGRFAEIGTWEWDTGSNELSMSAVMREALGLDEHEPAGLANVLEAVHPDDRENLAAGIRRIREGNPPRHDDYEIRVRGADGAERVLWLHYECVPRIDGHHVLFGTTRDVTEQRERQRRESSLGHRPVGVGTWSWRAGEDRVEISQGLRAMLGLADTKATAAGARAGDEPIDYDGLLSRIHEQDRDRVSAILREAGNTGQAPCEEFEFRVARGEHVLAVRTSLSVTTESGTTRLAGVAYDVSRLRELGSFVDEQLHVGTGPVVDLGTWEWDPNTGALEMSREFRLSYFPDVVGPLRMETVLETLHPDDRGQIAASIEQAADPEVDVPTDVEFRARRCDGVWRVLRLHAEILTDPSGRRRFAGTTYDVTQQRVLERQLAEHETLLSGSGRVTGIASWQWDTATDEVEVSEALCEVFGLASNQHRLSSATVLTGVHRHDRDRFTAHMRALRDPDGPLRDELEYRVVRADGQVRIVRTYAEVAGASPSDGRQIIGTVHDVTRLRQLERDVAHDRLQLAEARKSAGICGWSWRIGSEVLAVGPEAETMFGVAADEGIPVTDALARVHPDDAERLRDWLTTMLRDGTSADLEVRCRGAGDGWLVLRAYGERTVDEHGEQWLVGNVHDMTRLRELERVVDEGELHLGGIGKMLEVGTWAWTEGSAYVEFSPWMYELWGIPPGTPVHGESLVADLYSEDVPVARERFAEALEGSGSAEFEVRLRDRGGDHHKLHVVVQRRVDEYGTRRLIGTTYDLTAQWLNQTRAERSVQRYADLVAASPLGIALVDDTEHVVDVNDALCQLLGTERANLLGADVAELVADGADGFGGSFTEYADRSAGQPQPHELARADGTRVRCEVRTAASVQDDGRTFWIVMCSDVRDPEAETRAQGTDELTGLLNRAGVQAELRELLERSPTTLGEVAVLFCDVDNFARINDSLGHDFGDQVLVALAERLRTGLDDCCLAARHSGDEFVVVCSDLPCVGGLEALAERIGALLNEPITIGAQQVHISVSIGAAVPSSGLDTEVDLLRFADAAMFESKRKGGGAFSVAGAALIESMSSKLTMESQLRHELAEQPDEPGGGLMLHFQPVVGLDGHPIGAEALVRWNHPERGLLSPDTFLAVAAEADLMRELDRWVLRHALAEAAGWAAAARVAVNLSALLPGSREFDEAFADAIAESGIDPRRVVLELVETSLITLPPEGLEVMRALVEAGVRFAVDDFGTGYSSLARLKDLPVQVIKVDRKFVAGVNEDPSDAAVVRAVVDMAQAMGRYCVAEGVERVEQFEMLRDTGIDVFQGWLFSRPLPAAQFRALLDDRDGSPEPTSEAAPPDD